MTKVRVPWSWQGGRAGWPRQTRSIQAPAAPFGSENCISGVQPTQDSLWGQRAFAGHGKGAGQQVAESTMPVPGPPELPGECPAFWELDGALSQASESCRCVTNLPCSPAALPKTKGPESMLSEAP